MKKNVDKEVKPKKVLTVRSDEMAEILGTPPKNIIRYGITVIGAIIVMIIVGSAFVKYPDIVAAPITITTQSPPEMLVARVSGKPMAILVKDKQPVVANQLVAVMQNSASYADIERLEHICPNSIQNTAIVERLAAINFPLNLSLGEVQSSYNELLKNISQYKLFIMQQYYPKKEKALEDEIAGYRKYQMKLERQQNITQQDYHLTLKQLRRDSLLLSQKVIATADYEKSESAMLSKKSSVAQMGISATNAEIELAKLSQSLTELRMEASSKQQQLVDNLLTSYNQLKSTLAQWEEKYVLRTRRQGMLSYLKVWSTNQEVRAGETLFAIIPHNQGPIVGKALLSRSIMGKIAEGQSVNITLDGYPKQEFGALKGRVLKLSLAPGDSSYAATISVPQNLITTYKKPLHLRGELTGTAEISTDELSILARIWAPLKYMISQQKN
jgi:multidrug efflux pump subunit AcrA (membrane-fusion protein)